MITKAKLRISENDLKEAFATFEWGKVEIELLKAGGPEADANAIARALQRTNALIFKYPSPGNEKKRLKLFQKLQAYLTPTDEAQLAQDPIQRAITLIELAEAGYRQLILALSSTEASKLVPSLHVAAALSRAEQEIDLATQQFSQKIAEQPAITPQLYLKDNEGNTFDIDAIVEYCIAFVSMTIHMEAFKNNWFEHGGSIVLPIEKNVSTEAISQVGSTFLLATLWKRWQLTEERSRFIGKGMTVIQRAEWPLDAPEEVKQIVRHEGDPELELLHRVAAERMNDKLGQNFFEMISDGAAKKIEVKSAGRQHHLPPVAVISDEELHAGEAISSMLAYNILNDQERPGGLRLVEWIRGYAALQNLVRQTTPSIALAKTKAGWTDFFNGYGIASQIAEILIERLTYGRSSRDLFDQPLIKHSDGKYLLCKPAIRSLNIAQVTMSAIGNLGEKLQKKGKAFENAAHNCFKVAGIKTYSFKEKRGNKEYEYDLVVPWGDYLFIFECKNRSLPHGNPVQMHYFDKETRANQRQLKRLMQALDDHPDILDKHLGSEAKKKRRVGCVLNSLPYCIPGGRDGLYFYDFSALARFFKNGQISAKRLQNDETSQHFEVGARLWKGEHPTPEDLLAQLENPVQFKVVQETLQIDSSGFPLPPAWWIFTPEYKRHQHPSIAELLTSFRNPESTAHVGL